MTPITHFNEVWRRCAQLSALHAYLAANVSGVLNPDELLRAEWVARLSALDLYVHELVAQLMVEIFQGRRPSTPAYLKFEVSNETLNRIRLAGTPTDAAAAFDLEVRTQLGVVTYQSPDSIADGVRLISGKELWNEVALHLGATAITKISEAKLIRKNLSLLVQRRNKIAHEGDLQPTAPRQPWPILQSDLQFVSKQIETIVHAIDSVV